MNTDWEEGVQELVRRSEERMQQTLKLAAQAETLIRHYKNEKLELEKGWLYLFITISVIGFIYIATTRQAGVKTFLCHGIFSPVSQLAKNPRFTQ